MNIQCEFKVISCGLEYKVGQLRLEACQDSGERKCKSGGGIFLSHIIDHH